VGTLNEYEPVVNKERGQGVGDETNMVSPRAGSSSSQGRAVGDADANSPKARLDNLPALK
jgi:hypothetical protein